MIKYEDIGLGDQLKIVGDGAPGFAELGDIVTVTKIDLEDGGRVDVSHNASGDSAYFENQYGAKRLELVQVAPQDEIDRKWMNAEAEALFNQLKAKRDDLCYKMMIELGDMLPAGATTAEALQVKVVTDLKERQAIKDRWEPLIATVEKQMRDVIEEYAVPIQKLPKSSTDGETAETVH